jgi:hypothetical protein
MTAHRQKFVTICSVTASGQTETPRGDAMVTGEDCDRDAGAEK